MNMHNSHGLIGSLMESVPLISQVESKYDPTKAIEWCTNHFYIPIICSIIYLVLIYIGIKWMKNKPAYRLHQPLLVWNVSLALFAFFGSISLLPQLSHAVVKKGLHFSVCEANTISDPHIALWMYLLVISKLFELFDTAFVVLHKSSLQFLHWYHHTTVLLYCWYGFSRSGIRFGHWFAGINYGVHTLMYSYFAMKSAGLYVPSVVAQFITVLQILQMFVGLFINITVYNKSIVQGLDCKVDYMLLYMGLVMYGSYAVLFLQFFYNRYIKKNHKKNV